MSDPGWVSVSPTLNFTFNLVSSGAGTKNLYAYFRDRRGHISSGVFDSIVLDTRAPSITIRTPISKATFAIQNSLIYVGGTAFDGLSGYSASCLAQQPRHQLRRQWNHALVYCRCSYLQRNQCHYGDRD